MRALKSLYVQVLIGVGLGILVGALWPAIGVAAKPFGDAFIRLIRMLIAPIIFCTVAAGVARMSDMKALGRIGGRALIYFELVSTLALLIGLSVGAVIRSGDGFNVAPSSLDPKAVADYVAKAKEMGGVSDYLLHLIPDTFVSAFAAGDVLQVLLLAILTGFALAMLARGGLDLAAPLERVGSVFFAMIRIVVRGPVRNFVCGRATNIFRPWPW